MTSLLRQSWLVLALAAGAGVALAAVEKSLQGRIEVNRQARIQRAACEVVAVDPSDSRVVEKKTRITEEREGKKRTVEVVYYEVLRADGTRAGWAVPADTEKGYSGRIELMVGLDPAGGRITGLAVLMSNETPGLGNKIRGEGFRDQFAGKPADGPLAVVKRKPKTDTEIHAVTGATISSSAVIEAVNARLRRIKAVIADVAGRQPR